MVEVAIAALFLLAGLFLWQMSRELDRLRESAETERKAHRTEVSALIDGHRKEVAILCQRIQAPQIAVGEHMGQYAGADPPPVDLEDDVAMIEERKRQLDQFQAELESRIEELAVEV